jgi:uncharacterized membrane protein YphA (DoxX/SURF4 family)
VSGVFESYCREKLGPLALRVALGLLCVYHGYLKIEMAGGTHWYPGIPVGWQFAIAWTEFAAGIGILVGFRCRLCAAVIVVMTCGTVAWFQGWSIFHASLRIIEPTFLVFLTGLAVLFMGAGDLSIDGKVRTPALAGPRPPKRR